MKWFGISWNAPVCDPSNKVDIPINETCIHCQKLITQFDQGFILPAIDENRRTYTVNYHLNCMLDETVPRALWDNKRTRVK